MIMYWLWIETNTTKEIQVTEFPLGVKEAPRVNCSTRCGHCCDTPTHDELVSGHGKGRSLQRKPKRKPTGA